MECLATETHPTNQTEGIPSPVVGEGWSLPRTRYGGEGDSSEACLSTLRKELQRHEVASTRGHKNMIDIFTDGSCIGNPGPGGWAAIIVENGGTRKVHGSDENTTNNRMEILAAIQGIEATPSGVDVRVHSDSSYLINTMTKGWKRNKNKDLWARLDFEVAKRKRAVELGQGPRRSPAQRKGRPHRQRRGAWEPVNESGLPNPRKPPSFPRRNGNHSLHQTGDKWPHQLSHVDASGKAQMVDVGPKAATERVAVVTGTVLMQPETLKLIEANDIEKGDVLGVARIAGVMAAKNTAQLIPLCHPLPLDQITVEFRLDHERATVDIRATARTTAKTGVEMEAMTAVSVAALTVYDMCKAVDRGMRIGDIRLRRKTGGKSGDIVLE